MIRNGIFTLCENGCVLSGSVSSELRDLESKRQSLQQEVANSLSRIEDLKLDVQRQKAELERVKLSVVQVSALINIDIAHREVGADSRVFLGPGRPTRS